MKKKINNAQGSRAILYARVSTEEQAGKDHFSIEAQLNEMREFVKEKNWEIVGEFVDEGISGTKWDRPQLQAALSVAKNKECDMIVVHELSRLSRSVHHTLQIFEDIGTYGVGFASAKEQNFDFTDPSKRFFLTLMSAINEYYIDLLRQHTRKSKRERARQGLYNASIMPIGYDYSGDAHKPATINQKSAAIIKLAFESYSSGRYSDQEIADLLNQREYRTNSGRRFTKDGISQLLTNAFYAGKVVYHNPDTGEDEVSTGKHEAIISDDLWEKCQGVRLSRRTLSRAVQKKYRSYLLSNLAVCDVCGRTLRSQGATSGSYYREMSYERGFIDCPHQKTGVRAEILDQQVHALIENIRLPNDWLDEVSKRAGNDKELIQIQRQRERLEAERRRLQQMRIEGEFEEAMEVYIDNMERIRRESASIPTFDQIETLKITAKTIGQLYDVWENADAGDQRDLLRLMLREVRVDVANGRITSIAPLAVFMPIFRGMPVLFEYDFGIFAPLWENSKLPVSDPLVSTHSSTLPFFDTNPLIPKSDVRNAPGIATALRLRSGSEKMKVVQIVDEGEIEIPMDLRKWPGAKASVMSRKQFLEGPNERFDVVISQFILWKSLNQDILQEVFARLKPGGVWYFNELLPQDFWGHWLYRVLPAAWEWVRTNTWSLYTFYNQLTGSFVDVRLKRHVFNQPCSYVQAEELLTGRPRIVQEISQEALPPAFPRLKEFQARGVPLHSEFTVIEGWAKRPEKK